MSADAVIKLLAARHSKDVFVPECKTGPTQTAGARPFRLDAWVMPRSWAHPALIGYEVKVSRGDFLQDNKWPQYLDCCQLFYFVAPAGVIKEGEIPEQAGLLKVSKNYKRLTTVKKAPLRDVVVPESLWRYVMMCRASVEPEAVYRRAAGTREYWEEWLEHKKLDGDFGYRVGRGIQRRVREEIDAVNHRMSVLEARQRPLEGAKKVLDEMGLTLSSYDDVSAIRAQILRKLAASIPCGLLREMQEATRLLEKFTKEQDAAPHQLVLCNDGEPTRETGSQG